MIELLYEDQPQRDARAFAYLKYDGEGSAELLGTYLHSMTGDKKEYYNWVDTMLNQHGPFHVVRNRTTGERFTPKQFMSRNN